MKKLDLIIKNGRVVLEDRVDQVDIGIEAGRIVALEQGLEEAARIIDAEGLIVLPGMVDPHVHVSEPGRSEWEGYVTATRAAARGGVTTFLEMPLNQLPVTANVKALEIKFKAAEGKKLVDIAPYSALVPSNLEDLEEMDRAGVAGYKAFMSSVGDGTKEGDMARADDYTLYEGMKKIARTGKPLLVHCENAELTDRLGEAYEKKGPNNLFNYVESRPVFTELEAIRRAIFLAKETGVRLYICHISCPEGIEEVKKARRDGLEVYAESCTHYFAFSQEELDDIGNTAKCSPPIRNKDNQNRLFEKLLSGDIDTIASDHSPSTAKLKEGPAFSAWGGIASLQNSLDVLFDEAVQKRGMSLESFARVTATNAARIFGLEKKGSIALGKDADLVLIRENSPYRLRTEDLEYKNKISAYVGRKIGAQVVKTFLRGQEIYDIKRGVLEEFPGEFILVKN